MLFLLKDENGRALVIAEATTREEADRFGFRNFGAYCGRIVELDPESRSEAESYWEVPSLRVSLQRLDPSRGAQPAVAERPRRVYAEMRPVLSPGLWCLN